PTLPLYWSRPPPDLHSFPTRRSSDLRQRQTVKVFAEMSREETVGAVALDLRGNVAAGASTGGIAYMLPGRVGDTPLIGCGVYAEDRKSTRLNSSHDQISYAVFCLKKK